MTFAVKKYCPESKKVSKKQKDLTEKQKAMNFRLVEIAKQSVWKVTKTSGLVSKTQKDVWKGKRSGRGVYDCMYNLSEVQQVIDWNQNICF